MDQLLAEVLKAAAYSAAAFGAIATVARYSFLAKQSSDSTYVGRIAKKIEYISKKIEKEKELAIIDDEHSKNHATILKEIIESDGYKEYQAKRIALTKELIEKEPKVIRPNSILADFFDPHPNLNYVLNSVLGCDPLERIDDSE